MINEKSLTEEIGLLIKDFFECEVCFIGNEIKMNFTGGRTFVIKIEQQNNRV